MTNVVSIQKPANTTPMTVQPFFGAKRPTQSVRNGESFAVSIGDLRPSTSEFLLQRLGLGGLALLVGRPFAVRVVLAERFTILD
jgi:hypothetical protein